MVDRVRWLLLARSGRGTKRNAKAQRGKGAKGYTMLFVALWPGVRLWLVGRGKCRSHTETQRHEGKCGSAQRQQNQHHCRLLRSLLAGETQGVAIDGLAQVEACLLPQSVEMLHHILDVPKLFCADQ